MSGEVNRVGRSSQQALAAVLRLFGVTSVRPETVLPGVSAAEVVEALSACGISCQLVHVRPADLAHLQAPCLLLQRDGSWILVSARSRRGALVSFGDQDRSELGWDAIAADLEGEAIELLPPLTRSRSAWDLLRNLLAAHARELRAFVGLSLFLQVLLLFPPLLTRVVFDQLLPSGARSLLVLTSLGLAGVAAFQCWAGWLQGRAALYLDARLEALAARTYIEHLLRLPFQWLYGRPVAEVMQALRGLNTARGLMVQRGLPLLAQLAAIPLFVAVMASMLPMATLAVCAGVVALVTLGVGVARTQAPLMTLELRSQSQQRGYLVEILAGIGTLKVMAAERAVLGRWREFLRRELLDGLGRQRILLGSEVAFELLPRLGSVGVLIWGGHRVLAGDISVGSLMAFAQMASGLLVSATGAGKACLDWADGRPQLRPVDEVLAASPRPAVPRTRTQLRGPVTLNDVWFRYGPAERPVVAEFCLEVAPGQRHRIVGPSGFGKTTILRLIAGFYAPEQGSVRIDGVDPILGLSCVLYLPQFVHLYNGSIIENLRALSTGAPLDRLVATASETGLDEWVGRLPMGYDTVVPAGGGSFSGGQRQLIALTAALASHAGLLLLDEPMTNLDVALQSRVLKSTAWAGRTIIYAAHAEPL